MTVIYFVPLGIQAVHIPMPRIKWGPQAPTTGNPERKKSMLVFISLDFLAVDVLMHLSIAHFGHFHNSTSLNLMSF